MTHSISARLPAGRPPVTQSLLPIEDRRLELSRTGGSNPPQRPMKIEMVSSPPGWKADDAREDLRECRYCHGFGGKHYVNRACSSTGIKAGDVFIHFRPRGELIFADDPPTELVSVASRWMVG